MTAARTPAVTCSCIVVTASHCPVSPTRCSSPDSTAASSTQVRTRDVVRPGRIRCSPRCTTGFFHGTRASGPSPRPPWSTATSHTGPLPTRNRATPERAAAGTRTTRARFAHRPLTSSRYASSHGPWQAALPADERSGIVDDDDRRKDHGGSQDPDGPERDETATERADRNWNELLQELRVTQTGLQILTGFLLTVPFQQRFGELEPPLRVVFLVALSLAVVSTVIVVAPVASHRILFRRSAKPELVSAADRSTKAGLTTLALTIVAVVVLVFGFVAGTTAALVAGGVALAFFVLQWVILPARLLGRVEGRSGR